MCVHVWNAAGQGQSVCRHEVGVIPLQVPWVAVRLDSTDALLSYSPALHLSLGDPDGFTGGPAQALDLRMPEISERKSK